MTDEKQTGAPPGALTDRRARKSDPRGTLMSLIGELDAGLFEMKLEDIAKNVALAVRTHERKGQVSIVFNITPAKHSDMQVELSHQIKFTQPTLNGKASEESTTGTLVFVGSRGNMSILPESQGIFDFDEKTGEIK